MLSPNYEVDMTTQYWVIANFAYVTLRHWPFTFGHAVMSRDAIFVVNPCAKFELDISQARVYAPVYNVDRDSPILWPVTPA